MTYRVSEEWVTSAHTLCAGSSQSAADPAPAGAQCRAESPVGREGCMPAGGCQRWQQQGRQRTHQHNGCQPHGLARCPTQSSWCPPSCPQQQVTDRCKPRARCKIDSSLARRPAGVATAAADAESRNPNRCHKQQQLLSAHLAAPPSPHVVVAPDGLPIAHQPKVHRGTNELPVKGQVHATHGEQGALQGATCRQDGARHCRTSNAD